MSLICHNPNKPSSFSVLLKAKSFGIFSAVAVAVNFWTIPLDAYAQIAVDGSTATEVRGNVVSPTGAGTVNGGNLYNSFQEFNVPTSGVIFNTGSSAVDGGKVNNIINRVTGENPSAIFGAIESRQAFPNANLFLLNPNGIVFSPNAKLDIGGSFNVSTGTGLGFGQDQKFVVDQNSVNFPSGDPKNIQFAVSQPAAIINQGNLSVASGKDITIAAGTVINSGNLSAPSGNVSLAAVSGNSQVELRSPDLVLGLSVIKNAVPTNWNGTIATLPKLAELLTGQAAQANQVVVKPDGSIALVASPSASDIVVKDGMAIASGKIDVSSDIAKGGNIGIFGNQVGLVNSLINASGNTGGGKVLIGGDFQGKGVAPNALQTYVDGNSQIFANGLLTGDGGKVIIWADRSTQFYGAIAARGGDISGDGGFVEVSGKDNLIYQGLTDTLAINGKTGTLLLDPQNIEIIAGIGTFAELAANDQFADPPDPGTSTINNGTINAATSNVVLQATNDITFSAPINIADPRVGLTAQAGKSIIVNSSITTNSGSVSLTANDNIAGTSLGNITLTAPINLTSSLRLNSKNGAIAFNNTINGNQDLTINSGSGDMIFNGAIGSTTALGNITANSSGITRFNSPVNAASLTTDAVGTTQLSANITTSGSQTYNDPVSLLNPVQLNTRNSAIDFNNTINGNQNLTVNSGTGNITFRSIIGNTTPLENIIANSSATTRFNSLVVAASLTTDAVGKTELNATITTRDTQTFNDAVNLTNSVQLNTTNIAFNNTINGNQNLTVNAEAGNIDFNSTIGNTTPLANIIVNGSEITKFNGKVNAASLITDALGTTQLNADITTTGTQTYNDAVSLTLNPVQLNTTNSAITFNNTINGSQNLTVNSGNGDITFNGAIDGSQNLTVNSGIGNTTFNGAIGGVATLGNIFTTSAGTTRFNNTVNAASLRTAGVGGTTELNANNIVTSGSQTHNDMVNLIIPVSLFTTNSAIVFGNIKGNQDLTVSSGTGNITFNGLIGDYGLFGRDIPLGNIIANSSGITRFHNLVNAASLTTDAGGTTELNIKITTTGTQTYNDAVNLTNSVELNTTNNIISFNAALNGAFPLTLNTNGSSIFANAAIGNTTPLASLTIAPTTTLTTSNVINIIANGSISTGAIFTNSGEPINTKSVSLTSKAGLINVQGNITTANLTGQAANVNLRANTNLGVTNIDSRGDAIQGGAVSLTSDTGRISTGNITSSGKVGGEIFFRASTAINAGIINSSGTDKAGNVTLDPLGDVVVSSIDASSLIQGGNVKLVSTGGNLRITDSILRSLVASCNGSSICTSGGTGGTISLQTGGLNFFSVVTFGIPSGNGSVGILTTGISTIAFDTIIPVALGQTFTKGGISISPGGSPRVSSGGSSGVSPGGSPGGSSGGGGITPPLFTPPPKTCVVNCDNNNGEQNNSNVGLIDTSEINKENAGRELSAGNFDKAFSLIESAYVSELQAFSGNKLNFTQVTLDQTQDELRLLAGRTGNTATLIYPILLRDRIEILVVPPKGVGQPFRRSSTAANKASVEALITEYRKNLQNTNSNDYLEQSQDLYDLIIRPIDSQLTAMKVKTLVFVMDGGLRVMPSAAFHDGKQFLIERYAIAHVPTFSAIRLEERDRKTTKILAMGLTEAVQGFSALPSVDTEIKTISSNLSKGSIFLNKEFTVNNLQSQRQQGKYNVIHLGTHAQFVSSTSKNSFIQFWDSRLRLSEIPKLNFNNPVIDMLTLSACETAVGNNLGIAGLAVESGARSVLASLWKVSDAGTAPLMISFYRAFPDADNKAQAIRQAQLSLLGGKVVIDQDKILGIEGFPNIPLPTGLGAIDLSHPFYWSSFILIGNWL